MKVLNVSLALLSTSLLFLPFTALGAEVTASVLLRKGTIISDADIDIKIESHEDFSAVRLAYIGQELRRTIYAGHKISHAYVGPPIVVKRNGNVTMVYTYGSMKLTAKGRALNGGAVGDTITVMNTGSRKKVYGVIMGPEMVEVTR
ncbi:MAG: flagella basal body P-ring formation protein FlgA [Robiginitomaculum sp.]|nr:MAG: flagella basal body P-ring formation protein FlgA [Robiginitomaculum sp.]